MAAFGWFGLWVGYWFVVSLFVLLCGCFWLDDLVLVSYLCFGIVAGLGWYCCEFVGFGCCRGLGVFDLL